MKKRDPVKVGDLRRWNADHEKCLEEDLDPHTLFTVLDVFPLWAISSQNNIRALIMYDDGTQIEEPSDFIRRYSVLIRRVTQ